MSRRERKKERKPRRKLQRDSVKKGIYILPNLFTSAGLFAGFYSIVQTMSGDFNRAAWAVVIAGLCDGADGRVARMTHTTSRFGVEYDSLADLIAFGLAPGLLAYQWALTGFGKWGWAVAFLYVICGALRLARYNIQIDNIESVTFNGLPIPVAAGMVVSSVLLYYRLDYTGTFHNVASPIVVFILAFLMVSNVKFVSFKELNLRKRQPFIWLPVLIVLMVLVVTEPEIFLFCIATLYVAHGPIRSVIMLRKKRSGNIREILKDTVGLEGIGGSSPEETQDDKTD